MASQSEELNGLINFTGESAEEAQDFIQSVNKRAYAAGRQKDNAWIAEFAYPFFSRKALVWYETLDEETQNDWKLLKRAILAEFTARQPDAATVPSAAPALVSPTSAAPPPPAVILKIGRIRVDSDDHTKSGYFGINTSGLGAIAADSSKANIFEVDTLARTIRFQGGGESLAIRGHPNDPFLSPRTCGFGCMMKSPTNFGTQWSYTWQIAADGSITAMLLRTDGSHYDATFLVHDSLKNFAIHVPADREVFLGTCRSFNCVVTLHLEPLS